MRVTVGIGSAFIGHIVAACPWLSSLFAFTVHAGPESIFMVVCLTGALELMLFVVCMTLGVVLLHNRGRYFGTGLLTGWCAGLITVLGGGTALIGLLAAP
ncbi:hypothetical protein Q0Z83_045130 [Actinoplanes sichuanensis]|uniref:Uncharacterized protein n=1 Tax=Actinoplanes sichuanensis TaxID=512349 RepID=A0ABW4AS54_9ACTN|nr:hypothetical protein [Actinoplanes sichuanensis]BEL06322.1 hypothetical protein Q0Z83_045130 [Actinoplanes sichuanensis]